jgi:hypothetical protein
MIDQNAGPDQQEIQLATELRKLLLEEFKRRLSGWTEEVVDEETGEVSVFKHPPCASSTDLATIEKFLSKNGWSVDPKHLPQALDSILQGEAPTFPGVEDEFPE